MRHFYDRIDNYDLIEFQKIVLEYLEELAESLYSSELWSRAVTVRKPLFDLVNNNTSESWIAMAEALNSISDYRKYLGNGKYAQYTLLPVADACSQIAYAKLKSETNMINLVRISEELNLYEFTAEPLKEEEKDEG